jgi:hypothetical protein
MSREAAAALKPGEWWAAQMAKHLGTPAKTLSTWICRGW